MIKKLVLLFVLSAFCCLMAVSAAQAKGGAGPCLASCCLGPRIGLEMNEGEKVEMLEILRLVPIINIYAILYVSYDYGYQAAGGKGFLASCCLGPRVGGELDKRKIRTIEWLRLVPVVNLYSWVSVGMEAYGGKTMDEVAQEESLSR